MTGPLHTRLGKILLDAGANPNPLCHRNWSPLGLIGIHSNYKANFDDALKFAHMLIDHGATIKLPIPTQYQTTMSSPLDLAIARHDNRLVELIIRQGADKTLYAYSKEEVKDAGWLSPQLRPFGVRVSPLLVAIVSGNNEVTRSLLQTILLQQAQFPRSFFKDILVASCLSGDTAVISRLLLSLDLDLNEDWADGITPLVASAWNPDLTIARMLLAAGANIGPERCIDGREGTTQLAIPTPIHVAAFHGNAELVRMLIDRGASCNVTVLHIKPQSLYYHRDKWYTWLLPLGISSVLHLALISEDIETISLLLIHLELGRGELIQGIGLGDQRIILELLCRGVNILFTGGDGKTARDLAVGKCNAEIISLFFNSGGKYSSSALYQAIKVAIKSGDNSSVKVLLDYRSTGPIDNHEASCLVLALEESEWDLVHQLLSSLTSGPCPSFYHIPSGRENMQLPATNSSFHVYDPNDTDPGITPLWAACLSGHVPIIEEMLQQGYSLQKSDQESFTMSIMMYDDKRSSSIMKILLSTSQPAKMSLAGRQMLLVCAIKSYDLDEARIREYIKLVDSLNFALHVDPITMRSPLGWAIELDRSNLVSMLIDAGASVGYVNYETTNLESALSLAASCGNVDIVKLLIDREANGNGSPSHVTAALVSAAYSGHFTILQILIDHGADMNSLSGCFRNYTALEQVAILVLFARRGGHYVIANLLTKYGCWTQKDQMIYERPSTGDLFGIFQYDEQLGDWHHRPGGRYCDRQHRVYSQPTVSSAEPGTCDSSSGGEEEEADKTSVGALTLQHEMDQETDEWLHTVSDTFGDPAGFNIDHQEEANSPIALPLRPGNRVITEPNSPQQPRDGSGETETEELAGNDARGEQQVNTDSELTAREQGRSVIRDQESPLQANPMPELVIDQALGEGMELIPRSDPFFGADEIEDVWDI
ncbi:ankyrin repeat-containing domain protein [Xylaria arbuscula]|nr:ankyrin repeat-containing domain protein [Xylaria arbuscula]